MNRGLQPVLDAIEFDGCPRCGEEPEMISVNGPQEIILHGCGHVLDVQGWADAQYTNE